MRSGWRHVYVVRGLVYNSYFGNQVYNTAEIYCRVSKIIPKTVYLRNTDFLYAFVIIHLGFSVVCFFYYLIGSSITIYFLYTLCIWLSISIVDSLLNTNCEEITISVQTINVHV